MCKVDRQYTYETMGKEVHIMNKTELMENLEATAGTSKFKLIKTVAKLDLILATAKVGVSFVPTVSILGFLVPQYVITLLFIGAGATVLFKPEKEDKSKELKLPSANRPRLYK